MSEEKKEKGGFFSRLFKKEKSEPQPEPQERGPETEPVAVEEPEIAHVPEQSAQELEKEESLVKLRSGLKKTRRGFLSGLDEVFLGKKQLDDQVVFKLEEVLVKADIGVKTAYELLESVTERVKRRELDNPEAVVMHLKTLITEMLDEVEAPLRVGYGIQPFVVMVIGVNGSGKTTTIAKIAARHQAAGRKVLVVAGDTFRAAAVEQLQIWADRVGCGIVKGKDKADPSSVAYEAMETALREDYEVVLVDTAGRLHTRAPLMEELKKVHRILAKKVPGAPHETLLVLDSSMGQNAILQTKTFSEMIPVTGIALTKLDGTAKGGVVVGLSNELKIPIRFVGVGEKMDDLREFNARQFADALFTGLDTSDTE